MSTLTAMRIFGKVVQNPPVKNPLRTLERTTILTKITTAP
jgi:hypothetical protein